MVVEGFRYSQSHKSFFPVGCLSKRGRPLRFHDPPPHRPTRRHPDARRLAPPSSSRRVRDEACVPYGPHSGSTSPGDLPRGAVGQRSEHSRHVEREGGACQRLAGEPLGRRSGAKGLNRNQRRGGGMGCARTDSFLCVASKSRARFRRGKPF